MDFIINQVVQFQHIDIPNCHLTIEDFTCPPIPKNNLTGRVHTRTGQHLNDVLFNCAVKDWRRHGYTFSQSVAHFNCFTFGKLFNAFIALVNTGKCLFNLRGISALFIGGNRL